MLVSAGLRQAGTVLGGSYDVFRAVSSLSPLDGVAVATVMGLFDPAFNLELVSPEYRRQSQASFIGDPSVLQTGDYLVGSDTWFVSHLEPLRPASCTLCNHSLTVSTPAAASQTGQNSYGGRTALSDAEIASGWPASILAKTHIEIDPTRLPSDTKTSYYEVLLPNIPTVELSFGMLLQDEVGQNYAVSSAEFSISGWRLLAGIQTT